MIRFASAGVGKSAEIGGNPPELFSFFAVFIVIGADAFLNLKYTDIDRIFTSPNDIVAKFDNLQITVVEK